MVLVALNEPFYHLSVQLHAVQSVAVDSICVDLALRDAVAQFVPNPADVVPSRYYDQPVFPVVERDGQLVLLAQFDLFDQLRDAGVGSVLVWLAELDPGSSLLEFAVALPL